MSRKNSITTIKLSDGSELIIHYKYYPGSPQTREHPGDDPEWELLGLFHERPLDTDHNGVKLASTLTDLKVLIEPICQGDGVFKSLYEAIEAAVRDTESE